MRGLLVAFLALFIIQPLWAAEGMQHMDHSQHQQHEMAAFYGDYPRTREASGTSWQPATTAHAGTHTQWGKWSVMYHGQAQAVYTDQGGPRGSEDSYLTNMFMISGLRELGVGRLGLRGMFSLEPATIGKEGYPLLLQTGETADGETHLIDAQHPHDLLMELALTYSVPLQDEQSVFFYLGLPGEPALGPPAFMHRFSGVEFPDSPITHHWLDSTHITFGVFTAGYVWDTVKFEVSSFTGREPDQYRYNIDSPKFDSYSARLSWNPTPNWALQISGGRINSPEQLEPELDTIRYTASAMYGVDTAAGHWQTTLAWGRNINQHGGDHHDGALANWVFVQHQLAQSDTTLDGWLLESAWRFSPGQTALVRAEWVEKTELFTNTLHSPSGGTSHFHAGDAFDVSRLTLGYVHDIWHQEHRALGLGITGTLNFVPDALNPVYGETPTALTVFARVRF